LALSAWRSLEWTIGAASISALVVIGYDRIRDLVYRVLFASTRERNQEAVLERLSEWVHKSWIGPFTGSKKLTSDTLRELEGLVSLMATLSLSGSICRQARMELMSIRRFVNGEGGGAAESKAERMTHPIPAPSEEMLNSITRFRSLLIDFRILLRRKMSIDFVSEWGKLLGEYRHRLSDRMIEIDVSLPDASAEGRVHLKPEEFRHIFGNLLENSIAAMNESKERRISMTATLDSLFLRVSWTDTGWGVPGNIAKDLFNAPVVSTKAGGWGEGCYISRDIMRRRAGVIRYEESNESVGATFIVKLLRV
jgi:signal transduction histidine kinase